MLEVYTLHALKDNFVYMLHDSVTGKTAVVDPSTAEPVQEFLRIKGWSLQQIFCTHHHHDHVGGALTLQKQFSCPIYTSTYDFQRIEGATIGLGDGEVFRVGECVGKGLFIPGHTLGHWALYFEADDCVFVGDTLFSAGCGRLFEGTYSQMFTSLQKLKTQLKPTTRIYFGHEYTLRNLQFVEKHFPEIDFQNYRAEVSERLQGGGDSSPTILQTELLVNPFLLAKNLDEFKYARVLRDNF